MPLGLYIQDIGKVRIIRGAILLATNANTDTLLWYDLSNPKNREGGLQQPFITRGGGTNLLTASIEGSYDATVTVYTSSRDDDIPSNPVITAYPGLDSTVGAPKLVTIDKPFRWIAAAVSNYNAGTVDGVYLWGVLP
jgi:hypothetical protein